MAHFYFKFGAMGSTKTRELLAIDYNYRIDNGLESFVVKPSTDNRDGNNIIKSRDGGERVVDLVIYQDTKIFDIVKKIRPDIILVDESHFLLKTHVVQLAKIVDKLNIPVMAYGLKNDFSNEMFEGTKYLLLYADKIKEVKAICRFCKSKATMNMRFINGVPEFNGEQIKVGGNESYKPVCRKCYFKIREKHKYN